ncbi:MAG: RNA polymerase subunit sigma-70 [Phycisphaerae bacterium]|nr:RNA polymerase subunit sigma-70 [Phycisphaerae bacterium]
MAEEQAGEVTQQLRAAALGQPGAADALMRLVFNELRHLAQARMGAYPSARTLQPTALVNEAYVKLFGRGEAAWENRHHFFWAAARAMRDILVDHARHHSAKKRGGGRHATGVDLENAAVTESDDYLALDEAIQRLGESYPDAAKVVMLRFFSGLSREETAEVLGVSPASVWRDWVFAKAWLRRFLDDDGAGGGDKRGKE